MVGHLNQHADVKHILTLEDPIEYRYTTAKRCLIQQRKSQKYFCRRAARGVT